MDEEELEEYENQVEEEEQQAEEIVPEQFEAAEEAYKEQAAAEEEKQQKLDKILNTGSFEPVIPKNDVNELRFGANN